MKEKPKIYLVRISAETHSKVFSFCVKNGLVAWKFIDNILRKEVEKLNKE